MTPSPPKKPLVMHTGQVSGYGHMMKGYGGHSGKAAEFVRENALPGKDWTGLLADLKDDVAKLADYYYDRMRKLSEERQSYGDNIVQAAQAVHNTDTESAHAIHSLPIGDRGPDEPFKPAELEPVDHDVPDPREYRAPEPAENTLRAPVEQLIDWLKDVDAALKNVTSTSICQDMLEPLIANWADLERIGNVYGPAAQSEMDVQEALGPPTNDLKNYWQGDSADAAQSQGESLVNPPEGPLGQVVERLFVGFGQELEEMVREFIQSLQDQLKTSLTVDGASRELAAWTKAFNQIRRGDVKDALEEIINDFTEGAQQEFDNIFDTVNKLHDYIVDILGGKTVLDSGAIPPELAGGWAASKRGRTPQLNFDETLAELSQDVERPGSIDLPEGVVRLDDVDTPNRDLFTKRYGMSPEDYLRLHGITADMLEDPQSGFRAGIYMLPSGEIVTAYSGNDSNSFQDVLTVAGQEVGVHMRQFDEAAKLAKQVDAAFGQDNVVVTGHSLGGGLAAAAALATGGTGVTFQAQGLNDETIRWLTGLDPAVARNQADALGQIRCYQIGNDYTEQVQEGNLWGVIPTGEFLPDQVGTHIRLPLTAHDEIEAEQGLGPLIAPFNAHNPHYVVDAMTQALGNGGADAQVLDRPPYQGQTPEEGFLNRFGQDVAPMVAGVAGVPQIIEGPGEEDSANYQTRGPAEVYWDRDNVPYDGHFTKYGQPDDGQPAGTDEEPDDTGDDG